MCCQSRWMWGATLLKSETTPCTWACSKCVSAPLQVSPPPPHSAAPCCFATLRLINGLFWAPGPACTSAYVRLCQIYHLCESYWLPSRSKGMKLIKQCRSKLPATNAYHQHLHLPAFTQAAYINASQAHTFRQLVMMCFNSPIFGTCRRSV